MAETKIEDRLVALGRQMESQTGKGSLPMLQKGSASWNLWRAWRVNNGLGVSFMDTQERWCVPVEITPSGNDWGGPQVGYADKFKKTKPALPYSQ